MSVNRCYSEKKPGFDVEARSLFSSLHDLLEIKNLTHVRYLCRYDAEGLTQETYEKAKGIVFSEPMADVCYDEDFPRPEGAHTVLAVEPLPGQFDQRADSCAQCIQLLTGGERPTVAAAKIYVLEGALTAEDMDKIRGYLINPVDTREASMDKPSTLKVEYAIPTSVASVVGFTHMDEAALSDMLHHMGLAMDLDDLKFLQTYFRDTEKRDPTITEVRMVDTYWSDHCRHTTFSTHLDHVEINDPAVQAAYNRYLAAREEVYGPEKAAQRPQTLMDIATIGAKVLKRRGLLPEIDESEEINACSIHVAAQVNGKPQDWLLMFKNDRFFEESNGLYTGFNQSKRLLYDRWKKPGDVTDIPRWGVTPQMDSRFLEDASFLRLKNLMISYTFPQEWMKKTNFFTNARIYAQGQNLLTFTKFSGLDPEAFTNMYQAQYPMSRQYSFGLELSF